MTDLIEQVARALDPAAWADGLPIPTRADTVAFHANRTKSAALARQAIAIIVERCAREADEHSKARITLKANALERKSKQEARDHESMAIEGVHIAAAIRTLAGGENNGGV